MAREDLHFRLRIPEDLKKRVEAAAEMNMRSMTAEIVERVRYTFGPVDTAMEDLLRSIHERDVELERVKNELSEERRLRAKYESLWERTHEVSAGYREMFEHSRRFLGTYISLVQFLAGKIMTLASAPSEDLVNLAGRMDRAAFEFKQGMDADVGDADSLMDQLSEMEQLIKQRRDTSKDEWDL